MHTQDLWDRSAQAWIDLMERGDRNRVYVVDPVMLRLAGDVDGLRVCDVGCGEGRFCRLLAERGAATVGVEPTTALVGAARSKHPAGDYVQAGGERLPFADDSFDLVVSYLVLIDIPDYRAAIAEMRRVVRPGGRILVAGMNSFATTSGNPWIRDEHGRLQHLVVGDYFDDREDVIAWSGIRIVNFHRPFQDYMQAFLAEGLRLTDFEEPRPSLEAVSQEPAMADSRRIPAFHVMQWRKE